MSQPRGEPVATEGRPAAAAHGARRRLPVPSIRTWAYIAFALCVTVALQQWVGLASLYNPVLAAKQAEVFPRLLANEPPPSGRWGDIGMSTTQLRIAMLWAIHAAQSISGLPVPKIIRLFDTVFLAAFLLALQPYLRKWFSSLESLLGVSVVVCMLPLTYFWGYFVPWDRPSALSWLLVFWMVRENHWKTLACTLPLLVLVKHDVALVFGLYWLVWVRREQLGEVSARALVIAAAGLGTYWILNQVRPGALPPSSMGDQLIKNVQTLLTYPSSYQPMLVYVPLLVPLVYGWQNGDRFQRMSVVFAVLLAALMSVSVNFEEFRAHMPVVLGVLPCALVGLRRLLKDNPVPEPFYAS